MRPRPSPPKRLRRNFAWLALATMTTGAWGGPAPVTPLSPPSRHATIARYLEGRLEQRHVRWTQDHISRAVDAVEACSRIYGYEPEFILGLVEQESGYNPAVLAKDGSVGLVQIKPSTARAICRVNGWVVPPQKALLDPGVNITLGVAYLAYLEKTLGSREMALAGYNMGEIAAQRKFNETGSIPRVAYRNSIARRSQLIARAVPVKRP